MREAMKETELDEIRARHFWVHFPQDGDGMPLGEDECNCGNNWNLCDAAALLAMIDTQRQHMETALGALDGSREARKQGYWSAWAGETVAQGMIDSELQRRIFLAFQLPPSVLGVEDPVGESVVRLQIQRAQEERTMRQAPGDFAAVAARAEDLLSSPDLPRGG
jgi:hypothetical protein